MLPIPISMNEYFPKYAREKIPLMHIKNNTHKHYKTNIPNSSLMLFSISSKSSETSKLLANLNLGQPTSHHLFLFLMKGIYSPSTYYTFGEWHN